MPRCSTATVREQVLTLLASGTRTQKQVAKMVGASERSIRRWKNEGKSPSKSHQAKLSRAVATARRDTLRQQAKYSATDPETGRTYQKPIPKVKLPIQVPPFRRFVLDRVASQELQERVMHLSDNVEYFVMDLNGMEIARMLLSFADSEEYAFFRLLVRNDGEYEKQTPSGRSISISPIQQPTYSTPLESFESIGSLDDALDYVAEITEGDLNDSGKILSIILIP